MQNDLLFVDGGPAVHTNAYWCDITLAAQQFMNLDWISNPVVPLNAIHNEWLMIFMCEEYTRNVLWLCVAFFSYNKHSQIEYGLLNAIILILWIFACSSPCSSDLSHCKLIEFLVHLLDFTLKISDNVDYSRSWHSFINLIELQITSRNQQLLIYCHLTITRYWTFMYLRTVNANIVHL